MEATLAGVTKQLDNLTVMRVRELISEEEFVKQRQGLERERLRLTQQAAAAPQSWLEPAEMLVSFRFRAVSWFQAGDVEMKRLILAVAGSNSTLKGREVNIDAAKPFQRQPDAGDFPQLWSTVEDVRTGIRNNDPEMLRLAEKLKEFFGLLHSKGLIGTTKEEKLAA